MKALELDMGAFRKTI